jgi:polysaccharide deacetylase family protein (PEP-CTERM system associated)
MAQGSGPRAQAEPVLNAMTVDVEDYFQVSAFESVVSRDRWDEYERHVAKNTDRLLDTFAEYNIRATFFVLGWIADREPALVRRIAAAGHEIASHGYWHRLVYNQTRDEFRDDIRRARKVLEDQTGLPVLGYRAPSFSITAKSLWAFNVLVEEGFAWDASVFPIRHDRYGLRHAPRWPFWVYPDRLNDAGKPRFRVATRESPVSRSGGRILEVPASTVRIAGVNLPVGGGGYFRQLPYAWTRRGIDHINRVEGRPAVFYLHPWEVDPAQPRIPAPLASRLRHYRNLNVTGDRLVRLLGRFSFNTVESSIVASCTNAA